MKNLTHGLAGVIAIGAGFLIGNPTLFHGLTANHPIASIVVTALTAIAAIYYPPAKKS